MKSLPTEPDRSITYYKITNKEEVHNGLKYHDGLIIDHQEFDSNPKRTCVRGGIYFTTKEHLHKFFGYGKWIRPVTIPKSAKVVLDPKGDKYRADRLIFKPRKTFLFYFNNLFNKNTFPSGGYYFLTRYCSGYFNKWFNRKTFPVDYYYYLAVYYSDHFNKWFDKKILPEKKYWYLAQYCPKYFGEWFNKKTFPKKYYHYLAEYCSNHFKVWFDEETFPEKDYYSLTKYCSEHLKKRKIKL